MKVLGKSTVAPLHCRAIFKRLEKSGENRYNYIPCLSEHTNHINDTAPERTDSELGLLQKPAEPSSSVAESRDAPAWQFKGVATT